MYITLFVTVPDEQTGKTIARALLRERLVACANIVSNIFSMYWWEDEIQEEPECLMIMKTKIGLFKELEKKVKQLHPYDVPEIISIPIVKGHTPYLDWLSTQTRPTREDMDYNGVQF